MKYVYRSPEEQRQNVYDRLDEFVRDFSGTQGDLARFNTLPEEAANDKNSY